MAGRRISIVPHTHWDREWYEPFQSFRLKLVHLLDGLLTLLESDPSYATFLLDGQMAVVDDYLDVRPEAEDSIRSLAAAGRLTMGPWYILMDEFLVSAETIVRNLQSGIERGAAFGGVMEVGYLPDMFGHIAQMPQLLRLAGFRHAVVWRGVPSQIHKSAFTWVAPDGSSVRAEYLVVGYGNGASIPDDAKALVRRIKDHEAEVRDYLIDGMLFMDGTDHQEPQPWLGRVVEEANELQDDYRLEITSLGSYLERAPDTGLPVWQGELRSGIRANVLMGVTSNRVDVKRRAAQAELQLERRAEPYAALFMTPDKWPSRLLDIAWREMVRNSAHDSICACSVDDVVDAVLSRYAEARQIGAGIAEDALVSLARSLAEPGPHIVNPTSRERSGCVELVVPGEQPPEGAQVLPETPGAFGIPRGLGAITLDAATVKMLLTMLPDGSQIDTHTWIQDVHVSEDDTGIDLVITFGPEERIGVPISSVKQDLYTMLGARPDTMVRVRIDQPASQRIIARTSTVPGYGWRKFQVERSANPVSVDDRRLTMQNGLVEVSLDPSDGTFAIDGIAGFGKLVDGGDHGDSYNYSPPLSDVLVDRPQNVEVSIEERGPVRSRAVIVATYVIPESVDGNTRARTGETSLQVRTAVELVADEKLVRVSSRFVNPARDHRLRVHFPLPEPAAGSDAESAFGTVRRGLDAEGRIDEKGLPTFPAKRFVTAGALTVVHDGVFEYELVDIHTGGGEPRAHAIAVTLLRSTGMLSRLGMSYRPLPAGPLTPVAGLQLQGRTIDAHYGLAVRCDDPFALADEMLLALEAVHSLGLGSRPAHGTALEIEGAEVSSVRRVGPLLEVRVFNPRDSESQVRVPGRSGWLVDLRGRTLSSFDGGFELRPWGIATFRCL